MAYDTDDLMWGDPRRCPRHPHVVTSSPDGMFDGLCGECEWADEMAGEDETAPLEDAAYWNAREADIARMSEDDIDGRMGQQAHR